jgi:Ca-activated chloride channel family protein
MRFSWSNGVYILLALMAASVVWRLRRESYFGHPLLSYLREHIGPPPVHVYLPRVLEGAGLLFLCAALLDPVVPIEDHIVKNQGLNMVLVIDLSSSMQMPVTGGHKSPKGHEETRLEAVKSAIIDFIGRRKSDRIGVVVFSNNAYVVTPMTLDYKYLANYVELMNDRTLSDEGMTAIGEGLLEARAVLLSQAAADQGHGNVIVLLTDGENNTGRPVDFALKTVREDGIRTYFIGVEVQMGTTVENQGFNDAPKLVQGVLSTGGKYFDARDAQQLNQAYREINSLEKGRFSTKVQMRDVPAFASFAIAAAIALAAGFLLRTVPLFRELS